MKDFFWILYIVLHAIERMFQRDISEEVVEQTVKNGKVIEKYLDDKPYPSFLVLDFENNNLNKPIHVIFAKSGDEIIIITAYRPEELKWTNNYQTRIKK